MAIAKKNRFETTNLKFPLDGETFPPEEFDYEGNLLTLLGISNKMDLMPTIQDSDVVKAVHFGLGVKQLIYSDQSANLYDVCMYKDEEDKVFVYAIRTRPAPEKPRKKKEEI